MWRGVLFAALLSAGAAWAGLSSSCFDPQLPEVAFRCGAGDACPDGYYCGTDGCCHRDGTDETSGGPCSALAPDAALDAGVTHDASP